MLDIETEANLCAPSLIGLLGKRSDLNKSLRCTYRYARRNPSSSSSYGN